MSESEYEDAPPTYRLAWPDDLAVPPVGTKLVSIDAVVVGYAAAHCSAPVDVNNWFPFQLLLVCKSPTRDGQKSSGGFCLTALGYRELLKAEAEERLAEERSMATDELDEKWLYAEYRGY